MREIEPTAEDWERVRDRVENPDKYLMASLARSEARERIEREERERRRRRLNRLSLGLLGRR